MGEVAGETMDGAQGGNVIYEFDTTCRVCGREVSPLNYAFTKYKGIEGEDILCTWCLRWSCANIDYGMVESACRGV